MLHVQDTKKKIKYSEHFSVTSLGPDDLCMKSTGGPNTPRRETWMKQTKCCVVLLLVKHLLAATSSLKVLNNIIHAQKTELRSMKPNNSDVDTEKQRDTDWSSELGTSAAFFLSFLAAGLLRSSRKLDNCFLQMFSSSCCRTNCCFAL